MIGHCHTLGRALERCCCQFGMGECIQSSDTNDSLWWWECAHTPHQKKVPWCKWLAPRFPAERKVAGSNSTIGDFSHNRPVYSAGLSQGPPVKIQYGVLIAFFSCIAFPHFAAFMLYSVNEELAKPWDFVWNQDDPLWIFTDAFYKQVGPQRQ